MTEDDLPIGNVGPKTEQEVVANVTDPRLIDFMRHTGILFAPEDSDHKKENVMAMLRAMYWFGVKDAMEHPDEVIALDKEYQAELAKFRQSDTPSTN